MKQFKSLITGFLLALFLFWAIPSLAGVAGFKTALSQAFTNNFSPQINQGIANAYVSKYKVKWLQRVASGTADNPTNRGVFAVDMIAEEIEATYVNEQKQAAILALPSPSSLPQ